MTLSTLDANYVTNFDSREMKLRSIAALLIRVIAAAAIVDGIPRVLEGLVQGNIKGDLVVGGSMAIASGLLVYRYSKQFANFLCRDLDE